MPYDENFYCMYQEYLKEPVARRNHNNIFDVFSSLIFPETPQVLDLGCGIGEYAAYDRHHTDYVGVDLNNTGKVVPFIRADYMSLNFKNLLPFLPNAFISLFSIECFNPVEAKYVFYEKIFTVFPSVKYGLAGGFFYESKRDQEIVEETGGIKSYQTVEDPSWYISGIFTELRAHIRTPSRMFGQGIVEVWKFFVRNKIS